MRIKGDEVAHAYRFKLAQHHGAVKRLARGALVLSALVKHRHDNGNTSRLALYRADYTFKIGIVVIRAFFMRLAAHFVGNAVVEHIADDIKVKSAHRTVYKSLSLAASEARALGADEEALLCTAPLSDVVIDLCGKALAALHADYTKFAVKNIFHTSPK